MSHVRCFARMLCIGLFAALSLQASGQGPQYVPYSYVTQMTGSAGSPQTYTLPINPLRPVTIAYVLTQSDTDAWFVQGTNPPQFVQLLDITCRPDGPGTAISSIGVPGSLHITLRGNMNNIYTWDVSFASQTQKGTYYDLYQLYNNRPVGDVLIDPPVGVTQIVTLQ